MKKILITGGAGFIGYHLSKKLLNKGYSVDIIDNLNRGMLDFELKNLLKNKKINLIRMDLLKPNLKYLSNSYEKIFHLAAIIGVRHVNKRPYEVLINNVRLLENVIKIANSQKKLNKFIFFSTSEVYAATLKYYGIKIPTPENTNLVIDNLKVSRTSYMLSKIYGEAMCNISNNLPYIIIRPHNFYGPRMGFSHVISELIKKIYFNKKKYLELKSSNHKRSFCYIDDAVDIIYNLSSNKNTTFKTFNVGSSNKSISIYDLTLKISKILEKNIKIKKIENEIGSPSDRRAEIKLMQKYLKFKFNYNLKKGIKKTIDWYKENIFFKNKKTFI